MTIVPPSQIAALAQRSDAPSKPTAVQREALQRLHQAAVAFEGVFLQMVMQTMRETVPQDSIFGERSIAERTWQGMLDDERAQTLAASGSFGIASALERQLRPAVLADAAREARAHVPGEVLP